MKKIGVLMALMLVVIVFCGKKNEIDKILPSGGKKAGVDLSKKTAVEEVAKQFDLLLDKLEIEIKKLKKQTYLRG